MAWPSMTLLTRQDPQHGYLVFNDRLMPAFQERP